MGEVIYKPLIQDMVWSYSRIKAFIDCPYRWYLKYIRHPGEHGKDMFFSDYGSFVHELIASFYAGEKTAAQVHIEYLTQFGDRVKGFAPNGTVYANYFLDGSNYLKSIKPSKHKVIAVEQKVSTTVNGIPFVGYIDRIDMTEYGELLLIDNKSRTLKQRSKKQKPTKADIELDDYLRQLYIYSAFMKDRFGKFPSKLCFNCFRSQLMIEEPFNQDAFEDTLKWASDAVHQIEDETKFRPNMDYFKCRYLCEMNDNCDYYRLSGR